MKKSSFYLWGIVLIISSCSSFVRLNVRMLQPAAVTFRPEVNTVVLLNRATPFDKKSNTVEAVLTMESINADKQGRQQVLQSLHAGLMNSPRIQSKLSGLEYKGDGSGITFPKPLGWDTVARICKENGADVLVALETYDSDAIITHATGNVQMPSNSNGIPIPNVQVSATQKITIKLGFRIYDPGTRSIVDQYTYSYWRTWSGSANSIGEAIAAVVDRTLAINQTSSDAGQYYVRHISPVWLNETRYLYKKRGRTPFAIGSRMALVGEWEDAVTYWSQALKENPTRRKLCGRITYNLAVAAEIKGNLEEAREWISKSYGLYSNREAPYYQNTLNRKYNELQRLKQQLN